MFEDVKTLMPTKSRNRLIGSLMVLAVIVAAVVPQLWPQPSTLLTRSHRVAALGSWDMKRSNLFWLSDREALIVVPADTAGTASANQFSSGNGVRAERLRVQTGVSADDPRLGAALSKISGDTHVADWQLSPDGRWLLSEGEFQNRPVVWVATAVNSLTQIVRLRQQDDETSGLLTVWRPDSKSWVQILEQMNQVSAYSYRLDTPIIQTHLENTNLNGNVAVGFYNKDRLFCIRPQTGDGGGVGVMDLGVDASSAVVQNYIQLIPPNMDIQEVVLSPDRAHLAWKFTVKPLPLGIKATINSSYVRHSSPNQAGLWTSDLNFNHLHEIGTIDIRDDSLSTVRWMADGKHLSFIENNTLYTVPTN